jgi:SHS2 domain-containing protein
MVTPARWWTVEHTADLAIEVEAHSLDELFVAGGRALMGVLQGTEDGRADGEVGTLVGWRELAIEAPDREALLVDWLRELLYIQVAEELLFRAAEIAELHETKLVARVAFQAPSEAARVHRELKGVTYHNLELARRGEGWYARIVFDL